MGYEIHITRADEWSSSADQPITEEDWLAVVTADPELHIDESNGPYFAVWRNPRAGSEPGWFDWIEGRLSTKSPNRLGAVVQGDDGEVYDDPSQVPDDPVAEADPYERRQRVINVVGVIVFGLALLWLLFRLVRWISGS